MIFVILCILEFITYTNNKYFKEEPIKPYNIEVIYFNGDKDTIKNIKSDPYFDRTDRFKNDSDFNLGGVRSFKKIK